MSWLPEVSEKIRTLEMKYPEAKIWECPQEHQAVLLHAISLVSMKLCQFKGSTPKLKQTNWFPVLVLSGGG